MIADSGSAATLNHPRVVKSMIAPARLPPHFRMFEIIIFIVHYMHSTYLLSLKRPKRTPDNPHKCWMLHAMLDIFWGHFGSKSQVSGWTKMVSWAGAGRFYVLDTRSSPIVNFRSGECKYGQGQLCRAEFFYFFYFEMFEVCGSKNLDHGKFRNSNQPEVGSMFGQIGATQPGLEGHFGQKCPPNSENFVWTKMGGFGKIWDGDYPGSCLKGANLARRMCDQGPRDPSTSETGTTGELLSSIACIQPGRNFDCFSQCFATNSASITSIPLINLKRYALLQSADFLYMLSAVPKVSETFLAAHNWYQQFLKIDKIYLLQSRP